MGIGITGPDYSQITVKGIIGSFYDTLEQELAGSWSSLLGVTIPSTQSIETYRWLGLPPQLRLWLNARVAKGLPIKSFTIENAEYESTLRVDRNEMRFDKTGQLMLRIGEHAQRAAQHWEKLVTDLIEADGLCYDGQNFFDTDHSEGDSGSQSNDLAITLSGLPVVTAGTAAAPSMESMHTPRRRAA